MPPLSAPQYACKGLTPAVLSALADGGVRTVRDYLCCTPQDIVRLAVRASNATSNTTGGGTQNEEAGEGPVALTLDAEVDVRLALLKHHACPPVRGGDMANARQQDADVVSTGMRALPESRILLAR